MKQTLCAVLVLSMLFAAGCSDQQAASEGIPFYYSVASLSYSDGSTAIGEEYRTEVPEDLTAALELYLAGPQDDGLASPFPEGLTILSASRVGDTVQLTVSMELTALTGLDLTIACGCLTLTCLALTDAQQVQITPIYGLLDGQRTVIMDKNTLLLVDDSKQ